MPYSVNEEHTDEHRTCNIQNFAANSANTVEKQISKYCIDTLQDVNYANESSTIGEVKNTLK